MINKTI